jgi:hypothetical protein
MLIHKTEFLYAYYKRTSKIPAWKIESISSALGIQGTYYINTFVMKDEHLFDLEFTTDALKAPEMIPIAQKMIDSFRITTPQAPVSTPNATETANSLPQSRFRPLHVSIS